jgi:chorismate dehydratase
MTSRLRVAAVSYLNARPLIHTLGQSDRLAIDLFPPSECSSRLLNGEADIALIPSIEYSRIRETRHLQIIPNIAIVSKGAVQSVELFFNKGISTISRVAVDHSSRTSVALLRIILGEKFDVQPEFVVMKPDLDSMLAETDAALIIGDPALELADRMDNRLDLGEEWEDLTDGLPFVYAFWAVLAGKASAHVVEDFVRSKSDGIEAISHIADDYARREGSLASERYEDYLRKNISFDLGHAEKEGLREFYTYAFYYGLTREVPDLHFVGEPVT